MLLQNFLLNLNVKIWCCTTFDVQKSDRQLLVGMREVGAADAQTQLDLFQAILGKVCDSLENKDEIIWSTFINKKFDVRSLCSPKKNLIIYSLNSEKIFLKIPQKTLIHILWSNKKKWLKLINFFCGLHYLVGLADQAEACLKVWEKMLYPGQKMGCLSHGGYSNGVSGVRMVYEF